MSTSKRVFLACAGEILKMTVLNAFGYIYDLNVVLDLIITNLHHLYQSPQILAPLGSSDHNIVYWHPSNDRTNKEKPQVKSTKQLVQRRYPRSSMDAFGRWVSTHDWFRDLELNPNADSLAFSFTKDLNEAIDRIFPLKKVSLQWNDKPWI